MVGAFLYIYRNLINMKFNFIVLLLVFLSSCSNNRHDAYERREKSASNNVTWRSPSNDELLIIGRIIVKNNISGCGESCRVISW